MFAILKTLIVFLTFIFSVSAFPVPENVPRSVRELVPTVHQFHPSVDVQRDAAEQRLRLLERELTRQKERRSLLSASLRSSLISADLRLEESRAACNAVRNYNRSAEECARLPVVEETAEDLSNVCSEASDPGSCYADRLVNYEVLRMIFQFRCKEVIKQKMTIKTTEMVCGELRKRFEARLKVRTSENTVVMELKGVLTGLNILKREVKMLNEQIEAFTLPSPEITVSPFVEVIV